jgi:hypothetical protein
MRYILEFRINNGVWFGIVLLYVLACNDQPSQFKTFKLGIDNASVTEYLYLTDSHDQKLLFIEDRITASFEVYDLGTNQKTSAISFVGSKANSPALQAIISLNPDTLLVLRRNDPHLYFFNKFGHQIDRWTIATNYLPHFSTTHNFPQVYEQKLYIPFFPANGATILNRMEAHELVVDLNDRSVDTLLFSYPARKQMGLRHHLAKRTLVAGKFTYLWGNGEVLTYDLTTKEEEHYSLDSSYDWKSFQGDFLDHYNQLNYYQKTRVYDHMIYNPYKNEIYIVILLPIDRLKPSYQRDFEIMVFNKQFERQAINTFNGLEYVYNMSFVTEDGLFISKNHPLSTKYRHDELSFSKILFE